MKRILNAFLGKLNCGKRAYSAFVLCATTAIALPAQNFTTLHTFDNTDGANPFAGLVQATNGGFYGTTFGGGANGDGTVFIISPSGTVTSLYSFCSQSGCTDGQYPDGGLVQATNGDLYGTPELGGTNGSGTVFKMTPGGTLTTLYSFCSQSGCPDGQYPTAGLAQSTNGDFYGTTSGGGANGNYGTVFRITPSGTLTTLYSFCAQSGCTDGLQTYAGLVQATNGDFYGTTSEGGANASNGTVFKITPNGDLTTLYSFCAQSGCTDGSYPYAGLIQAANGDFYGTTLEGGANLCPPYNGCGTVFKITPKGALTTLYRFCAQSGCADGKFPYAGLVQATDEDFYGATQQGGAAACDPPLDNGCGTLFRVTGRGTLTTLYTFCAQSECMDGGAPQGALVQDTDGDFYGTTAQGGASGAGTVFRLSTGLGPFVEMQTTSGKVGAAVKILGSDLTGATSVSFNGTSAVFKVVSSSEIKTIVPASASSGKVQVVTPSVTLSSNVPFRVLP
jgi:uncharacterized repeat protein (TIGR03803 family)